VRSTHVFRAHADSYIAPVADFVHNFSPELNPGLMKNKRIINHVAIQKIYLLRTDKACHKGVCGFFINNFRRVRLLNNTLIKHNNPVAHCQRLGLVMRYINKCRSQALMQPFNLGAHLHAKLCVKI